MRSHDLDRCLELASRVEPEGRKWPWQSASESGGEVFAREWAAAVQEEVVFDGSGDLLTAYFLAQSTLNDLDDPFDSPEGMILAKVFTAAFPARAVARFPALEERALKEFCADEWGDDGPGVREGIAQAQAFVESGMARIGPDQAVVFVIG